MRLSELATLLPGLGLKGDLSASFSAITVDSRDAGPGVLFIAVKGSAVDGHDYLQAVIEAGCRTVLVQEDASSPHFLERQYSDLSILVAKNTRPMPALVARILAGKPDTGLMAAGVTGTNGKTTVSYLLQKMLEHLHGPCGLLGTISYDTGKESVPAPLTTPGGPLFYQWLGKMKADGCRSVAMELSSHALDQERTAGLHLDVAIMTNLGRDHLDYHHDLGTYLQAKARIMEFLEDATTGHSGVLVLNAGDPELAQLDTGEIRVLRFNARESQTGNNGIDFQVIKTTLDLMGTEIDVNYLGETYGIISPLVGRFNVENLTASFAAGIALGFKPDEVSRALALVPQVPGRLERIALPSGALAVVDYAHTHDALAAVLGACRELTNGRLIVVFGCGGDRDSGKRPLMGAVAARDSDGAWITSDNPRSEIPEDICAEIEAGFMAVPDSGKTPCRTVVDRREAIECALAEAQSGDIVVVAGKGHEDYQLVGDQVLSLDDRAIIRDWIGKGNGDANG